MLHGQRACRIDRKGWRQLGLHLNLDGLDVRQTTVVGYRIIYIKSAGDSWRPVERAGDAGSRPCKRQGWRHHGTSRYVGAGQRNRITGVRVGTGHIEGHRITHRQLNRTWRGDGNLRRLVLLADRNIDGLEA